MQNRRFYDVLNGKESRWKDQRNCLHKDSVLSPILFNIYINDQPLSENFIYPEGVVITVLVKDFGSIELNGN